MDILNEIISKKDKNLIQKFQTNVFNGNYYNSNEKINEILLELAYDLDYYEPNKFLRMESTSFYGDELLEKEIVKALKKLNKNR